MPIGLRGVENHIGSPGQLYYRAPSFWGWGRVGYSRFLMRIMKMRIHYSYPIFLEAPI